MMRLVYAAFVAAFAFAGAAQAALAPHYYEEARRTADSVVVVRISEVDDPPFSRGFGDCVVHGRVAAVERGSRYSRGQRVALTVPCMRSNAAPPASGTQWQSLRDINRYRWGRAWLTPEGDLALSQYEILRRYP